MFIRQSLVIKKELIENINVIDAGIAAWRILSLMFSNII